MLLGLVLDMAASCRQQKSGTRAQQSTSFSLLQRKTYISIEYLAEDVRRLTTHLAVQKEKRLRDFSISH
jgi:hypothetical protein